MTILIEQMPISKSRSRKIHYAWALEKQGQSEDARKLREEAQQIKKRIKRRFEHVNVDTIFMAPINVEAGQEFEVRLEIVNLSRAKEMLVQLKN